MTERAVFDCNVYFQALISPAGACLAAAEQGQLQLFVTETILLELTKVCSRPQLVRRFGFTPERIRCFVLQVKRFAEVIGEVPHVFDYKRDPDDEYYVDLVVACGAKLIASRDKDLLALGNQSTVAGRDFHERFPDLEIIEPVELLARIG